MKKIISLGIASAVCALTAIAASAATTECVVTGDVVKGQDIVITVNATEAVNGVIGNIAVTGLEVKNVEFSSKAGYSQYKAETGRIGVGVHSGNLAEKGEMAFKVTAKVTAATGEAVSFTLTADDGAKTEYKATVVEAGTTNPSKPDDKPSTPDDKPSGDNGENTETGVALAVVPAVLAAAGVIVAKKRK